RDGIELHRVEHAVSAGEEIGKPMADFARGGVGLGDLFRCSSVRVDPENAAANDAVINVPIGSPPHSPNCAPDIPHRNGGASEYRSFSDETVHPIGNPLAVG